MDEEKLIRQIFENAKIADKEIKTLSDGDEYKERELHRMFQTLTLILRLHDAPLSEPGFTDILRLVANISDLIIEQSKHLEDSSDD